jgi:hypothetical protein
VRCAAAPGGDGRLGAARAVQIDLVFGGALHARRATKAAPA